MFVSCRQRAIGGLQNHVTYIKHTLQSKPFWPRLIGEATKSLLQVAFFCQQPVAKSQSPF